MNLMTRKKAMNILDLKEGFTEDDLKRAYKKQARLHHPDNYDNASEQIRKEQEEMMKEVNSAYDYLLKHKSYTSNNDSNNLDLEKVIKEFESYTKCKEEYYEYLKKYIEEITDAVNGFKRYVARNYYTDMIETQMFLQRSWIRNVFKTLKEDFIKENYIDDIISFPKFNYNCSIGEFYEQLLKLVPKYSKKYKFEEKLEQEKEKYQSYKGYDKLKDLIDRAVKNVKIEAKESNYTKIEESLNSFNKQVNEIFELYYGLLKEINNFNVRFNKLGNMNEEELEVQNNLNSIVSDFNKGASFLDIFNRLQEIAKKVKAIEDERERKKQISENKEKFTSVYELLLERYNNKLRMINILEEKDLVDALTSVFSKCIDVINKVVLGVLPFESLLLLNRIKFDNLEEDIKVLSGILETVKEEKEPSKKENNQSNIFVLKEEPSFLSADYTMFFIYDEQNNTIYREDKAKTISNGQSELLKYIPIEDFLKHNVFLGEEGEFYGRRLTILFDILHDSRYICLIDDKIVLLEKNRVLPFGFFSTKSLDEYKNIYSLIKMLKRQLGLTNEEPELKKTQSNRTRKKYDNSILSDILSDIRLNF